MRSGRVILLHIRSSRLRAAIRRLLEQSVEARVELSDDGRSTTDMVLDADVLVVDVTEHAFAEQILDIASCARLKPYVIVFAEEPEQLQGHTSHADGRLVQFFAQSSSDLAKNLVSLVADALRRRFLEVAPAASVVPEQDEQRWLAALADDDCHQIEPPPAQFGARLRQALPATAECLVEAQRRPRCLALRSKQHLPWECLLPPQDVERDAAPFVPARLFPREAAAPQEQEGRRSFRAAHFLFPTVDVAEVRVAGADARGRSGIRGDRGLKALQRFAQHIGGVCMPIHGAKTPEGIALACADGVDLLHVTCHARISGGVGEVLLAENTFGDARWVTGHELAKHLEHRPPRVVVLEACGSGLDPQGVAAELIRAGVEAVICFQVRPAQDLAAMLIERFYRGLEETRTLDHAVWATRFGPGPPVAWLAVVLAIARKESLDALAAFSQ